MFGETVRGDEEVAYNKIKILYKPLPMRVSGLQLSLAESDTQIFQGLHLAIQVASLSHRSLILILCAHAEHTDHDWTQVV